MQSASPKRPRKPAPKATKAKKKKAGYNLMPYLIIAALIGLTLTFYIGYRASISDRQLFSVGLLALIAGLMFETFRVSDNWKLVILIFAGTYLFSLISFLPGRREQVYNFENHIEMWPYFFIFFFALFFGIAHKDRVTAKLTEGITLLLSISIIYWAFDYGFMNYRNWFAFSLLATGLFFALFSIVHALTHIQLSRSSRLTLSVWSTVVMFAFAIDNIIHVFTSADMERSEYFSDRLYIGIQYFLLGTSAVYIVQNYLLLAGFLPSKNGNYKEELKENKLDHINRYSDKQVSIGHSLFCIAFTGTVYWLNHQYQLLPRHTMIWLVFFSFPFILQSTRLFGRQEAYR
ncbi:hypothetical protein [Pseudocnuella soli]|uniref:hypothetical protein n=1 Tax=Pseudocnuella soli TaxID=2502779 RepID=UPI0010519AD5|nr:hypothetical protein [Pseudocnuella soli]